MLITMITTTRMMMMMMMMIIIIIIMYLPTKISSGKEVSCDFLA